MAISTSQHENPYASPTVCSRDESNVLIFPERKEVEGQCEKRKMLYRRIRLTGIIEGVVEWDARTVQEIIRVGGKTVMYTVPFWYTPRFDFHFTADEHQIPATVEVRLTRLLPVLVRKFRLTAAGKTVYEEGKWTDRPDAEGGQSASVDIRKPR